MSIGIYFYISIRYDINMFICIFICLYEYTCLKYEYIYMLRYFLKHEYIYVNINIFIYLHNICYEYIYMYICIYMSI